MDVYQGPNQPSQQKPGIEIGLYQQKHCQLGLKETEKVGQNERRLLHFLDSTGPDHTAIVCSCSAINVHCFSRQGKKDLKSNSKMIRVATPTTGPEGMYSGDTAASISVSKGKIPAQWGQGCATPTRQSFRGETTA